ncbi:MAG: ABC transporter permease subunit [Kiritimatiellae bacterium]|nr:ABC transporter permease subunit [Kiritimatiellia bacterium]
MSIISKIGRKTLKVRLLILTLYATLFLGSLTMIYPFLIMISGSTKSGVDTKTFDIFPAFLKSDTLLYQKHVEGLFNERLLAMKNCYNLDTPSFEHLQLPRNPSKQLVQEWEHFLIEKPLPPETYALGYVEARVSKTQPLMLRNFKGYLTKKYDKNIETLNRRLGTEFVGWNAFYLIPEDFLPRQRKLLNTPFSQTFTHFKEQQPLNYRHYFMLEGFYRNMFLKTQYTKDIGTYNQTHGTDYISYDQIYLSRTLPAGTIKEREDWENFVRKTLNLLWIHVNKKAQPFYQAFLQAKYNTIETLNRNYETHYKSFEKIPLIEKLPSEGVKLSDWGTFIAGWQDPDTQKIYRPEPEHLQIIGTDFAFQDYLMQKYTNLETLNNKLGTIYQNIQQIRPPQYEAHYFSFLKNRNALKWEFIARNYITVIDYMVLHGRGIINTIIYCVLAVLAALIFNPLAAYAMSRYCLPNTYKILLFMLLTMAFPPMVTQIPVFLMLRDFHLLNTFAALILPGLVHGYSIFLLKGFFDSLPRDLFDSAQIDGANEWTLFWQITMSLSKPILAVIALQAFNMAYSNFMFALLICQNEKMWTLMVWLYQLQQRSGQAVIYASLIIAAIPTFFIFLFCQKIIMRGIVVPVEK